MINKLIKLENGHLSGDGVENKITYLKDLEGYYEDSKAFAKLDGNTIAYQVEYYNPSSKEIDGALSFGVSHLQAGKVGREYFFTKGHGHAIANRSEFYWHLGGSGLLLLLDEDGEHCRAEKVENGSVHYIGGYIAHRLVNTGNSVLSVGACWNQDAGHDYSTIKEKGFGLRIYAD